MDDFERESTALHKKHDAERFALGEKYYWKLQRNRMEILFEVMCGMTDEEYAELLNQMHYNRLRWGMLQPESPPLISTIYKLERWYEFRYPHSLIYYEAGFRDKFYTLRNIQRVRLECLAPKLIPDVLSVIWLMLFAPTQSTTSFRYMYRYQQ